MTKIHPTAIIAPTAVVGENCYIGPFCNIGPNVTMGSGNRFEAYCCIGVPADHRDYFHKDPGQVIIGNGNVIREFVTISGGTTGPTKMGSNCVLLRGAHVSHDALVRDSANLSHNVMLGGHTIIGQGVNLGLGAVVHQNRAIGAYAMVGMHATVTRNVTPFLVAFGSPARPRKVNKIGLLRAGVPESELRIFEEWFQMLDDTGSMNPIEHELNSLLKLYLTDCQGFQRRLRAAA